MQFVISRFMMSTRRNLWPKQSSANVYTVGETQGAFQHLSLATSVYVKNIPRQIFEKHIKSAK